MAKASGDAKAHLEWSGSVHAVVDPLRGREVPVTVLIDAMMDLHGDDYLDSWSWEPARWPADPLVQPTERWMIELEELFPGSRIFGRIALVGWSLLDDKVATAAQSSGILSGVARSITPAVSELLSEDAGRLLRRRAPLAALSVGELPPTLTLPGAPGAGAVSGLALSDLTRTAPGSVGAWAAAAGGQIFVGHDAQSVPLLPSDVEDTVLALGFSSSGRLHAVSHRNLYRVDPKTHDVTLQEGWPLSSAAAVDPQGVVVAAEKDVYWAAASQGEAVPLGAPSRPAHVATAGSRVAALIEGELLTSQVDHVTPRWSRLAFNTDPHPLIAATHDHVYDVTEDGHLRCFDWDDDPADGSSSGSWGVVELDQRPLSVAAGRHSVVLAAQDEVTIVEGRRIIARFRPDLNEGQTVTAVGLSHDGSVLALSVYPLGLRFWRVDTVPEVRLSSYIPDTPAGQDLLAIRPTVDALAAILVARAVDPPIAIGLFGEWGSGKSFFMKQLEIRIEELSDDARRSGRAQRSLWAWRNVTQVSFNAWHYAAADVWAGLLEHLVRVLAQPRTADGAELRLPIALADLQRGRATTLEGALAKEDESELVLDEARDQLERAAFDQAAKERALVEARQELHRLQSQSLDDVVAEESRRRLRKVLGDAQLPLVSEVGQTIQDIRDARDSTRSAAALIHRGNRRGLLVALVLAWVLGILAAWGLARLESQWSASAALVTALVASVGAVARWITSAADEVAAKVKEYDDAEVAARAAESQFSHDLVQARTEVEKLRRDVTQKEEDRRQAQADVEKAGERVRAATPGSLLVEYLEGRDTAGDYRAQLGLIGTVRGDLQLISDAVSLHNRAVEEQADVAPDDVVNRIVLYIDDLDRCPPEVVVKVLEAVSMLLTFPMFVVVVAVDAQWISRSLVKVYPEMLSGGDVTPDNYLEKIFQLPVWLDRPSDDAAAAMARVLLGSPASSTTDVPWPADRSGSVTPGDRTAVEGARAPSDGGRRVPAEGRPRVTLSTSPPTNVVLDESESAGIEELAPLVSRSPRALKRFINTYRVLKALVPLDDLGATRLVLAIATSRPALGERLLDGILRTPDSSLGDLVGTWDPADRAWIEASVPAGYRTWPQWRCADLRPVAKEVRRFMFHVDRPSGRGVSLGVVPAR